MFRGPAPSLALIAALGLAATAAQSQAKASAPAPRAAPSEQGRGDPDAAMPSDDKTAMSERMNKTSHQIMSTSPKRMPRHVMAVGSGAPR